MSYRGPRVFLVGAGPGDPGLITVRGLDVLRRAEVVLYDRLVHPALLDEAPTSAEKVYVGKRTAKHTVPQDEINRLLVQYARQGRFVVRLKGGDPFVFGRGGEEAAALEEHGLAFEIVPGVTAGNAVPAYAGIPVTHRGLTSHVTFVTGHEDPTKESAEIDWDKLASDVGTLVIFMGVRNLPRVVDELRGRGRPADTPVALIRYGTMPQQRTVVGTLEDIVEKVAAANLRPPAITIIGEVVSLRDRLAWFERRPLFGRRIVVTRPVHQAAPQIARLRELGADVLALPTIRIQPVEESREIDAMLRGLEEYDFVIFTSANGVRCFFDRLSDARLDVRALHGATVVAIGPKTAEACRRGGLVPDLVPETYVAEGVLEALESYPVDGTRVLIPRARKAREVLPRTLTAAGGIVEVVPMYDTLPEEHDPEVLDGLAKADFVTFTSSSSVSNFAELLRAHDRADLLPEIRAASIGPVTSETVRSEGLELVLEAAEYTVDGLIDALVEYAGEEGETQAPPA